MLPLLAGLPTTFGKWRECHGHRRQFLPVVYDVSPLE